MFEWSTNREWHILSRTSSDSRGGLLEQVAWMSAIQRQEKTQPLTVNDYLLKHNDYHVCIIYTYP